MHHNIRTIKNFLPFLILVLYSSFISANSVDVVYDTGIVFLSIVNRPPVITDIYFNPETAFEGSRLECVTIVNDEDTEEIKLIYKWYLNNKLIETSNNHLTGFNENDLVKCEVTPVDSKGAIGETKSSITTISKKSTLSAITGFIVKSSKVNFSAIFNFLF